MPIPPRRSALRSALRTALSGALTSALGALLALGAANAQALHLSELDPVAGTLELHNPGDAPVDAADLWLCNRPAYARIGDLEVVSGEPAIPPGGTLVLRWDAATGEDGELGLYAARDFGDPAALLDYLQWGSSGHARADVAGAAGVWDPRAFLPWPLPEGEVYAYAPVVEAWVTAPPGFGDAPR